MVAALLIGACAGGIPGGGGLDGQRGCAIADSLLAASGLSGEWHLAGRTTIDVNQYRVRGRFRMTVSEEGDVVLEFTSTSPMGGSREDVVVSLYADTLRIFDRERGRLHVGSDIDDIAEKETGVAVDMARLVPLLVARMPDCRRLSDMGVSESGEDLGGRLDGHEFSLTFSRGRLEKARWPLPLAGPGRIEALEAEYEWDGTELSRITARLPDRRWRVRLDGE